MPYCIYCNEAPCTCTADQRFARKYPNVTDQERDQIRKDALFERHQAQGDLALHRDKLASLAGNLGRMSSLLSGPSTSNTVRQAASQIPSEAQILAAYSEFTSASERLRAAEKRCADLGLD